MHISLIGMSGCGKTRCSLKLQESGFRRFSCDELITEKVQSILKRSDGTMLDIGEWVGFPYENQFRFRESKYLSLEEQVLSEILDYLDIINNPQKDNIVVDTTGSVIYTSNELMERLRKTTMVIHLSSPPEIQAQMLERYLANRRPLIWRNLFNKRPNESNQEALARCFQRLLISREELYQQHSHITIPYHKHSQNDLSGLDFINIIFPNNACFVR